MQNTFRCNLSRELFFGSSSRLVRYTGKCMQKFKTRLDAFWRYITPIFFFFLSILFAFLPNSFQFMNFSVAMFYENNLNTVITRRVCLLVKNRYMAYLLN